MFRSALVRIDYSVIQIFKEGAVALERQNTIAFLLFEAPLPLSAPRFRFKKKDRAPVSLLV